MTNGAACLPRIHTCAIARSPAAIISFAELICADSQWLRAEFDALIQASFGEPPAPPPPPAPARVPPR